MTGWGKHCGRYRLVGHLPVPENDLFVWGQWLETADRQVARSEVGPMVVSTVFIGLDHNFGSGKPMLFETMIFDGGEDDYQTRCATWDEAEAMHANAVRIAEARCAAAEPLLRTERQP
jgi:hypothetical protein